MTFMSAIDDACQAKNGSDSAGRHLGVLIADDDPLVRRMLGIGLQVYGFRVLLASNGLDAVEIYRQQRETIDVVLLDVRMPGLDGPRAIDALRVLNPTIRCCLMSGETAEPHDTLERWRPDRFFLKPFSLPEIAEALFELVPGTRSGPVT
jgi:two-component system, cell cycle sensor histidine kinase and response regulator CckA